MDAGIVLIVAFVSVAIGYGAGLFLTKMNADKRQREERQEAGETVRQHEVTKLSVTLWSKIPDGPLSADLFGKTFTSADQVSIAEKNRLAREIQMVQSWFGIKGVHPSAESMPAEAQTPTKPEQPEPAEVVTPAAEAPGKEKPKRKPEPAAAPAETAEPVKAEPVEPAAIAAEEIPLPAPKVTPQPAMAEPPTPMKAPAFTSASELDVPSKILEPTVPILKPPVIVVPDEPEPVKPVEARIDILSKPKPKPGPKSIVQQIDDILQEYVANSPMASIGIKLQETPQGVLVWIGKESFQGVDTVPEGDAKKMIKAAVRDWESRG